VFTEVVEIDLVAARLGKCHQLLKTRVILILNFTRPHAITYTNLEDDLGRLPFDRSGWAGLLCL